MVLNFAAPAKNINYTDFLLSFKLLYGDINCLRVTNFDKNFVKSRLKDCTFLSFRIPKAF